MVFHPQKRAVGLFPSLEKAAVALCDLKSAGFPMKNISAIARKRNRIRGITPHPIDTKTPDTELAAPGLARTVSGGSLGMVLGLLISLSILTVSGIGPLLLAAMEVAVLSTVFLTGGAIGAVTGSVVGPLLAAGMTDNRPQPYGEKVVQGDYLLILTGTDHEIALARQILKARGIQDLEIHKRSPLPNRLLSD
jgi:hypothetical protein